VRYNPFRRAPSNPLSHTGVSAIRTDTRSLVGLANQAATARATRSVSTLPHTSLSDTQHALSRAQERLTLSILAALSQDLNLVLITRRVIQPELERSVVLSDIARDRVQAAVAAADFVEQTPASG
jgi:hypothetical protein